MEITIPHKFQPRDYQIPLFRAMDSGFKRAVCIWHRRAGKDKSLFNLAVKKAIERVGAYYYFFPTYQQGRKILWEGMDRDGLKFLDHVPKQAIKSINNQEMKLELINGSIIRVIGTDNIDSIVGTNPVGCIFSEYSLQDPTAWDFIRPILAENGGWAVFNYTPRGHNHGKQLFDMAQRMPETWFSQKLTVDDTHAIKPEVLDQERVEMIERTGNEAHFLQEYYCSFDAPVEGAYYGSQMLAAERSGRITNVPYDPALPVHTFWDLGVNDSTAIWFLQLVGKEVRCIDYLENNGEGLAFYVQELQKKSYVYGDHYGPHDIEIRELSTGKSRIEFARSLGINFKVIPNLSIEDGIEAVRMVLPRIWFDRTKCERGINALNSYCKEWDEKNKVYKTHPLHNWASHAADAMRGLAVGLRDRSTVNEVVTFGRGDSITGYGGGVDKSVETGDNFKTGYQRKKSSVRTYR